MGDGRYYSSNQFFSIVYLTILIIFLMVTFMLYIYKGKKESVLVLFAVLLVSILTRFVETIAVSSTVMELCKGLNIIFLSIFMMLYTHSLLYSKKIIDQSIFIFLTFLFCLSYVLLLFKPDYIIVAYILLTININILANYFIPYSVTTSIFGDIKELVLDYVFIIDDHCKVIYKNNSILHSDIFNRIDKIDIRAIEELFVKPSIVRKAYDKSFIKVLGDDLYFQYNKKEIINKNSIAGYIITFTDITDLINMLDNLKIKKEEANSINTQLALYKEIVYDKEKEREINILLQEIANNQQKSMQILKKEIGYLRKNINEDFKVNIEKAIEKAKEDLFDVRSVVSKYINYYDN